MSTIFGSPSKQSSQGSSESTGSSQSSNQAYPALANALGGQVNTGTGASNQLANILGLNGQQGQNQGFQNFQQGTGYQFGLNQGTQAITQGAATQGLLNSGATAKALDTYGQNYANTQYQNYLNPLQNLVNSGTSAAGTIAGAGQQSSSQNQSQSVNSSSGTGAKQGLGGFLGTALSGVP